MEKDVFATKEFNDYAEKNLVLVEVDFPRGKAQSAALKKANNALKDQFKIDGFPTLVALDASGKKIGDQVGYGGGGTKAIVRFLDGVKSKK